MATLNPYLNFRGQAREALDFYQSVFGGEVTATTLGEGVPEMAGPGEEGYLMHGQLVAGDLVLMAADVPASIPLETGSSISVSLSGTDEEVLTGYYEKISAAGTIVEPLAKAPWGDSFAMVDDQFGIHWMFNIGGSPT